MTIEQLEAMGEEEMETITKGTNMEALMPEQAYDLDQKIADAAVTAVLHGVPFERFLELCEAAMDCADAQLLGLAREEVSNGGVNV
jgi:hypothetical protein